MGVKITPEFIQHELEVIGRLETAIKAEVGALRDELRQFTNVIMAQLQEANARSERMADRIIQLAMIAKGDSVAAVGHQRGMAHGTIPPVVNSSISPTNMWGDPIDEEEDEWPPKGYDTLPCP